MNKKPLSRPMPKLVKRPQASNAELEALGKKIDVSKINSTVDFFNFDFPHTLFPLNTNRFLINKGELLIKEYIDKCLDEKQPSFSFLPQTRVYSSKPGGYLRRTVKLDVASEFYVCDAVYRNRSRFRKPHTEARSHYGYRFENGSVIPATQAYKGFKGAISAYSKRYKFSYSADVATYFNSLYHHDIVGWLHTIGVEAKDAEGLGQLLREIASGRSIDCLPQGLYPTKMIGNDFLRYIDDFHDVKSEAYVRFLDDMYWFSDNEKTPYDDFQTIQRLLGDKGLSLNPRKTHINSAEHAKIDNEIDSVKTRLLKRRRIAILAGYDNDGNEIISSKFLKFPLNEIEMKYLNEILQKSHIEEDDAELILTIMKGNTNKAEKKLPYIINNYPNLAKNVHTFFSNVSDKDFIAETILNEAKSNDRLSEYQLFWFCCSLESYLLGTRHTSSLISVLFNHRSSTHITKSKILEIDDARYGLQDLRNQYLANGQSDWLGWSSAVGSRSLNPATRNYKLKYFAKCSNLNFLISNIISSEA